MHWLILCFHSKTKEISCLDIPSLVFTLIYFRQLSFLLIFWRYLPYFSMKTHVMVLIRSISMRRFQRVQTTYISLQKYKEISNQNTVYIYYYLSSVSFVRFSADFSLHKRLFLMKSISAIMYILPFARSVCLYGEKTSRLQQIQ